MTPAVLAGELMASKRRSLDPRKYPDEVFDLYSIPAFDAGAPIATLGREIGSAKQVLEPGDVLLSRIVPHIRRAWVVAEGAERRSIGSSEWIVFRSEHFHPPYLRHLLVADRFHGAFMATVAGVGGSLLRARPAHVAQIPLQLPPIEEQRRIAAVLDHADELRAKRRASLALIDALNESIFLDMFGDRRRNRMRAPVVPLVDLVDPANPITRGIDQPGPDVDGGVPYIKTTDFGGPIVRSRLARAAPEIAAKFPRSVVQAGDSVICIRATVGPAALVGDELSGANLSRGTARVAPAAGVEPRYLLACLQSADFQNQIRERLRGATFLQIPLAELRQLKVLNPPQAAQREFVRRVAAAESAERAADRHRTELEVLFASLQHRAFSGQL